MPKNNSAARREQARRLAGELGITYTAALRRLDPSQDAPMTSGPDSASPVVRKSKKAIRAQAAATGRTYLDAATSLTTSGTRPPALADPLRRALATALEAAGWPVEIEHHPQAAALRSYAGPAAIDVARADEPAGRLTGDEHPDDPIVFDLAAPLRVAVWAPLITAVAPELDGSRVSTPMKSQPTGRRR